MAATSLPRTMLFGKFFRTGRQITRTFSQGTASCSLQFVCPLYFFFFDFICFCFHLIWWKKKIERYINLQGGGTNFHTSPPGDLATFSFHPSSQTPLAGRCSGHQRLTLTPHEIDATGGIWAPESEPDSGERNHAKLLAPVSSTFSPGSPAPLPRQGCAPVVHFTSDKVHCRLGWTGMKRLFWGGEGRP